MRKLLILTVLFSLFLPLALPEKSLAAARVIKNVRVSVNGKKQYYDLFQSPVEASLWYCGQTKPSIIMRNADNLQIPEISIIRFQRKDVKNPQKLIEGAHFKMSLSLGPDDETLEELKKKIPSSSGGKPVILSPVPFDAVKLFLQRPDGQEVELKAESLSGISSQHSSQNVAFSTVLGMLDTDILDALMRGNTGAKYSLFYNYQYIDPLLSGKAAGNTSGSRDFTETHNSNTENQRDLPGTRDFNSMEKENEAKTGWEKAGEGFVGLGKFSRTIQDKCIFIEKNLNAWENAYLSLPFICLPAEIAISSIKLDVSLMHEKKVFESQSFTWTPGKSWRDSFGAPLVYGVFDLTSLKQKHSDDMTTAFFAIKQKIESNSGDTLISETTCDMIEGDSPVSDPLDLADVFELDTGLLKWTEDGKDGLKRIEVELTEGSWKSLRTIKIRNENGRIVVPRSEYWLIRRGKINDALPLLAEIHFVAASGNSEHKIPWALNGKDLRSLLPSLSVIFFDKDWFGK